MMMDALGIVEFATKAASWWLGGAALLVLALTSVSILRGRTSAAQRHGLLVAAVVALLALPVLGTTLPTWDSAPTIRIEVPAAAVGRSVTHDPLGRTTVGPTADAAMVAMDNNAPAVSERPAAAAHPALGEHTSPVEVESSEERLEAASNAAAAVSASGPADPRSSASSAWDWRNPGMVTLTLWGLGVMGILGWMGMGVAARTMVFARGTTDVRDPYLILQLAEARNAMGVRRSVRLRWSESARVPATWGAMRPVIVLPTTASEWDRDQKQAALLHEMAHVARFDHLLQTMSRVACALHWFNPLVWRTASQLAAEAEHASDDRAIAASNSPTAYARELVNVARTLRASSSPRLSATVAMARTSDLEHRVEAILDRKRSRRRPSPGLSLTVLVGTIVITGMLSAWTPRFEEVSAQVPAVEFDQASLTATWSVPTELGIVSENTASVESNGVAEPTLQEAPCVPGDGPRGSLTEVVNGRDAYTDVFWDTGRCNVTIRLEGVRFNADETDVASIADGGRLRIEQEGLGPDRRLDVSDESGELRYRYREDGQEVAYDASARSWLAEMIPTIFRVTGLQMEERIDRLWERGGAEAVLDEVRLIHSDHTAGSYLAALMEIEELQEDDLMTAFQVAGANIESDHELSQILEAGWRSGLSGPARESFLEAAQGISSDHALSEVLKAFLDTGIGAADVIPLLSLASTIESDHALGTTLTRVVETVERSSGVTEAILKAAEGIESDHELGNVLGLVVEDELTEGQILAVIDVAGTIASDHEHATLLRQLVESQAPFSDTVRRRLVDAAETIGSDYERDRTLAEIARGMNR